MGVEKSLSAEIAARIVRYFDHVMRRESMKRVRCSTKSMGRGRDEDHQQNGKMRSGQQSKPISRSA